jgi:hypothetical protein
LIEHKIYVGHAGHGPGGEVAVEGGGGPKHTLHVRGAGQVRRVGGGDLKIIASIEVASNVTKAEADAPLGDLMRAASVHRQVCVCVCVCAAGTHRREQTGTLSWVAYRFDFGLVASTVEAVWGMGMKKGKRE